MLHSGKLDRKVTLKTFTTLKDSWNYDMKTESDFATVWAQRIDKRPSEEVENKGLSAITRTEWTIRFVEGVKRTMWLVCDGERFDIVGIRVIGRREYLTLVTEFRESD